MRTSGRKLVSAYVKACARECGFGLLSLWVSRTGDMLLQDVQAFVAEPVQQCRIALWMAPSTAIPGASVNDTV